MEHPNYGNGYEHEDDIAILWFWKPFVLNKWVQPACLPTKDVQLAARDKLRVSGFGRTDPNDKDSTSSHLILVDVPYINDRSCQSYLGKGHTMASYGDVTLVHDLTSKLVKMLIYRNGHKDLDVLYMQLCMIFYHGVPGMSSAVISSLVDIYFLGKKFVDKLGFGYIFGKRR